MKGGSRTAGEFITETGELAKERGRRREKEILQSFISQPTDVLPSQRRQAGGRATQPPAYTANMTPLMLPHLHILRTQTHTQQSGAWK